jgi:glutamate racemase
VSGQKSSSGDKTSDNLLQAQELDLPLPTSPIVVLDSGLGGLTVVRALRRLLPGEDIVYFGDTARVPYGSKSAATVTAFVHQIIAYLLRYDPKHVVIACNTASALSLQALREAFAGLAISGVLEPGARAAVAAAGSKLRPLIGVIGTEATIRSGAYERAIVRRRQLARLLCLPTPLLAPIIEEGRSSEDPLVQLALRQYLKPLLTRGIDVLVLGCTHYPVYRQAISQMMGEGVAVIDSASQCAEDVQRRLRATGLLRGPRADDGWLQCFVTDESPRFATLAFRFLGLRIQPPHWVPLDELHAEAASAVQRIDLRPAI